MLRIDEAFDRKAVGEGQYQRGDLSGRQFRLDSTFGSDRQLVDDLCDAAVQSTPVRPKALAEARVTHSAGPIVQEQELPVSIAQGGAGEYQSDLMDGEPPDLSDLVHELQPGVHLAIHELEKQVILSGKIALQRPFGAKRGDQKAFAVIVHTYQRLVFTYVFRLVDDRRLAEDLTQDVFLRVFRGLPGFTESSAFTTWLFQITKNRVIDELRAIERRPHAVNIDEIAAPTLIEPRFEQAEPIQALWAAVGELNLDLRTALLLRDVVGLSYVEIADALEVTITTVKWRIHKARESVQATMEQQGFGYGSTAAAVAPTSSKKR